jgi:hypothetical protein
MALLTRKRLILAETESTYGTDPSPDGADAILVRDLNITPQQSDVVSRDLVRPYLGASEQLLANTRVECTFSVELAGSGTAGTAPRFGKVLKACALAETTVTPAETGTATAGASNSITLAAGASATDDIYNGQVIRITAGLGVDSVFLVTDYVGATKVATLRSIGTAVTLDNTSVYSIDAQVVYTPVSSAFGSVTLHYNIDGVLHRLTGCRGTFSLNTAVGEIPTIDFTMTGIYNAPTDTAAPVVTYADQATPRIFKAGNSGAFTMLGYSGCLQSVSMDLGNTTVYRELVGCTKEVLITDRASTGTVVIEAPTIAQKDYFTAALTDGTLGELSFIHGTTGGNIVALQSVRVDIGDPSYQDQDGIHMLSLPYTAIPSTAGNDEFRLVFA